MLNSRVRTYERDRGLANSAQGKRRASVLGVQAPNIEAPLDYERHAEELAPDALISCSPPTRGQSMTSAITAANFGYAKEEYKPVTERMTEVAAH